MESPLPVNTAESFGRRLRRLMEEQQLNQTTLAQKVGIDRTELNRLVNEKRQPKMEEIGWLAAALGISAEAFTEGLELPADIKKGVERFEEAAFRLLNAEAQRDEAVAQIEAMRCILEEERSERAKERDETEAQARTQEAKYRAALNEIATKEAVERETLRASLNSANAALDRATADIHLLRQSVITLRGENTRLQSELKKAAGKAVLSGILSGLTGLALGVAGGRNDDQE